MEIEVGAEGSDVGKFRAIGGEKSTSSLSPPKHFADPVMYKLVRVEQDGRFVPATDDEVMEVESLLVDVKSDVVAEAGLIAGCISNVGSSPGITQPESTEGLLPSEDTKVGPVKINAPHEETVPSFEPGSSEACINQSAIVRESSNPPDTSDGDGFSPSDNITTSVPDFSKLKGKICLDSLSIRELQETFRATFGRETTVKDKQWLKRRITMGLTNTYNVSTTTFIIEDNKLLKTDKLENCSVNKIAGNNLVTGTINGSQKDFLIGQGGQLGDSQVISREILGNQSINDGAGSDFHDAEQRASKRTRKPTKRYIEELSEVETKESCGRLMVARNSGLGVMSPKAFVRPLRNVSSDWRTFITRLDSLGGSAIQVPRVPRVRRSRPRKNFMALLKFNLDDANMAATLVKRALGAHNFASENSGWSKTMKEKPASEQVQDQVLGMDAVGQRHSLATESANSSGNLEDNNTSTVRTSKGGIRRKHHRAWTLNEVVKLVDGVSRYGAGKWSEIKRLAFASYSYRTSVDLKDKWRNLLKASLQQPTDKAVTLKKNTASTPIPAPILLKVRELAEMQSQVPSKLSSGKAAADSDAKIQNEKQSGYL